jgi:cytidylate kinase
MPLAEAVEYDEAPPAALERLLRAFATWGPSVAGTAPILPVRDGTMPEVTEQVIYEHAERTGGVILGRAGAIVLRDHPGALHVRLTGPPGARVEQAMRVERVDRPTAERRLEQTDRARAAYVNFFYGVDPHDPALYHLVLDSTALPVDTCVAIIAQAARARAAATPAPALR